MEVLVVQNVVIFLARPSVSVRNIHRKNFPKKLSKNLSQEGMRSIGAAAFFLVFMEKNTLRYWQFLRLFCTAKGLSCLKLEIHSATLVRGKTNKYSLDLRARPRRRARIDVKFFTVFSGLSR